MRSSPACLTHWRWRPLSFLSWSAYWSDLWVVIRALDCQCVWPITLGGRELQPRVSSAPAPVGARRAAPQLGIRRAQTGHQRSSRELKLGARRAQTGHQRSSSWALEELKLGTRELKLGTRRAQTGHQKSSRELKLGARRAQQSSSWAPQLIWAWPPRGSRGA